MSKNKELAHATINNNTVKRILIQVEKCKKERLNTLKGFPDNYKLKDLRIRENEIKNMHYLIKKRIEKQFIFFDLNGIEK